MRIKIARKGKIYEVINSKSQIRPIEIFEQQKCYESIKECFVSALSIPSQLNELLDKQAMTMFTPGSQEDASSEKSTTVMCDTLANSSNIDTASSPTSQHAAESSNPVHPHQELIKQIQQRRKRQVRLIDPEYIDGIRIEKGKIFFQCKLRGKSARFKQKIPEDKLTTSSVSVFMEEYCKQVTAAIEAKGMSWAEQLKKSKPSKVRSTTPARRASHRATTATSASEKQPAKALYEKLLACMPDDFEFVSQYALDKVEQARHLREVAKLFNMKSNGQIIMLENEVNLEKFVVTFEILEKNVPGPGVVFPTGAPLVTCDCEDCGGGGQVGGKRTECCPALFGEPNAYKESGTLRSGCSNVIYECNSGCRCGVTCYNRRVQLGSAHPLCVFRTEEKGWGVKTLERIPKGSFVIEYTGEVINNKEAEVRGVRYDEQGVTYLFDLDIYETHRPLTIDATCKGNVSRFINHSCNPNMFVISVFIDFHDPSLPRIAFFTRRDVNAGEELTFDYKMSYTDEEAGDDESASPTKQLRKQTAKSEMECKCGAYNCRKVLVG